MKIGKRVGAAVFLLLLLAGCGDQPGIEGPGRLRINRKGVCFP